MSINVTRGYGLLEKFLAERRVAQANSLIDLKHRKGRVLDIGSGSHPFFLLNTIFFEKFGVDQLISENDKKKYLNDKIKLFRFDIDINTKLEFADNYFDCIIMLAVAEHLREKELLSLLHEVHRVLKKDGCFIYTTPAAWSDIILKIGSYIGFVSRNEIEEHKEYYDHEKMKKLLVSSGFDKNKMKFGYFEFKLNTWGMVTT